MITEDATLNLGNGPGAGVDGLLKVTGDTGEYAGTSRYDATPHLGTASFGEAHCVSGHGMGLVRWQLRRPLVACDRVRRLLGARDQAPPLHTSRAPLTGNKGRQ